MENKYNALLSKLMLERATIEHIIRCNYIKKLKQFEELIIQIKCGSIENKGTNINIDWVEVSAILTQMLNETNQLISNLRNKYDNYTHYLLSHKNIIIQILNQENTKKETMQETLLTPATIKSVNYNNNIHINVSIVRSTTPFTPLSSHNPPRSRVHGTNQSRAGVESSNLNSCILKENDCRVGNTLRYMWKNHSR